MDTQWIFQQAREDFLKEGELSPMLYVQLEEGGMVLLVSHSKRR